MFKILIVEDNASFRKSLKEILSARFPSIIILDVADGKEALKKFDMSLPDLIFMDIKLPGESGLELTKRIKTHHPKTVIVILTIHDLPEYREAAYQCGANYFLSKGSSTGKEIVALVESIASDVVLQSDSPNGDLPQSM